VGLHVWALHHVGQNNPIGITEKTKSDTLSFHPYYTVKDAFAVVMFLLIFAFFLFYQPDALGHADNYIEADALKTPPHIVPEWYFLPFYAILRAVPDKLAGILLMFGAIAVLFVLPWLDTSKVRSMRFRPVAKWFFWIFLFFCFILGWCGAETPDNLVVKFGMKDVLDANGVATGEQTPYGLNFTWLSRIGTIYYFAYFLVILPVLGLVETPDDRPESITKAVLGGKSHGAAAPAE
jgi:ubiquinol-cytochrome c reductase cytochrome b subunit